MRRNNWRLASLYICTMGLFLIVSLYNFMSFKEINDTTNRLTRDTYPIDHTINRMLIAIGNQETGIRGYLLTKDPAYLDQFELGKSEVGQVKELWLDDEIKGGKFETEIASTFESLANVETSFIRVMAMIGNEQYGDAILALDDGEQDRERLLESFRHLETLLTATMKSGWSDQNKRAAFSMGMIIVGAVVTLIAIVATWLMFRTTKNALRSTFESERQYRRLVNNSPDAIAVHQDGVVVFANPACAKLMGVGDSEQLIGLPMMRFVHKPYVDIVADRANRAMKDKDVEALDEQFVRLDGSLVDVEVTAIGYPYEGRPAVLIMAREIGIRKEAERTMKEANELLYRLSTLDGLTSIPNRRSFDQDLQKVWDEALNTRAEVSLVLFDVDNFKAYNDFYGHQAGDACLQTIARIADEEAGKLSGSAYRYGGEEFAILLPNHNRDSAKIAAEQVRRAVNDYRLPNEGISAEAIVTISVGVATWPNSADQSPEQWLRATDQALYQAKYQGRNSISEAMISIK